MGRPPKNPATKLASLRLQLGMTQAQFARMLGIDRSKLSRAESKNEISDDLKSLIADCLGPEIAENISRLEDAPEQSTRITDIRIPIDFKITCRPQNPEEVTLLNTILMQLLREYGTSPIFIKTTFKCMHPSKMNRDEFMIKLGTFLSSLNCRHERVHPEDEFVFQFKIGDFDNPVTISTKSPGYIKKSDTSDW